MCCSVPPESFALSPSSEFNAPALHDHPAAALLLAAATSLDAQELKGSGTVALRAARLIDGTGAAAITNGVVVVTDDKIVAVGKQGVGDDSRRREARRSRRRHAAAGLHRRAHAHHRPRAGGSAANDAAVRDYQATGAIIGVANAQKTLLAGFTTIRNVGAPNFDDMALRKAVNEGNVIGPRMQNAGHAIGITGGHCDENGFRPGLMDGNPKLGIADGPDQIRAAVRYQAKYGADVIKMCATGGVLSEGDAVGVPQYTYEEMKALVDEATKLERKVAAHAHGAEGIKIAVRAGVSSIEHGSFLDEEGARLMVQHGTYLVPTLSAGEAVVRAAKAGILKGLRAQKARAAAAAMNNGVKIAVKDGVPIALGTDAGVGAHGTNGHEFTLMVEWGGMTPMQSIVAGTMSGAKLLGWDKQIGSLAAGKWADVVAVPGDPLQDIHVMERPVFVMKNGYVYKSASVAPALP